MSQKWVNRVGPNTSFWPRKENRKWGGKKNVLLPNTSTTHRTVKWAWAHPRNNNSRYIYT